jgi:glycerophosphoryl diester phosphodiesterase
MRDALKNFILAVLSVVMLVGIGWIVVRNRALSKPLPHPFPHKILEASEKRKPLLVALRGDSAHFPANSKSAFESAARNPDMLLWIDVFSTGDNELVAWTNKDLSVDTDGKGWVNFEKLEDLRKLDAGFKTTFDGGKTYPFRGKGLQIQTLKEVLAAYPDRLLVINFQDYKEGMREAVGKLFDETKVGERSLVTSPEDGILRDLREAHPTWIFGTSQAQVTRLLMLADIFVAMAAPMKGDIFVWPPPNSVTRLTDRAWEEIERRQMKSFITIEKNDDVALWKTRASALVSSDPEWLANAAK